MVSERHSFPMSSLRDLAKIYVVNSSSTVIIVLNVSTPVEDMSSVVPLQISLCLRNGLLIQKPLHCKQQD